MNSIFIKILFLINLLFIVFGLYALAISSKSNFRELELSINVLSESLVSDISKSKSISQSESLNDLNSTVQEMSRLLALAGVGIRGVLMISVLIILINTIYMYRLNRGSINFI